MTGQADRWIRVTTIGCVALLALIAGTVSYIHMHVLVVLYGQPGWVAALTPLSVDGMIVAASTTLLADSRSGRKGGALPWALLVVGSVASLAANVAVAEPALIGRVIAAWPSFALTVSYELLIRQVRHGTAGNERREAEREQLVVEPESLSTPRDSKPVASLGASHSRRDVRPNADVRRQAWRWATTNRVADGALPSGRAIAGQFGRHERWGRLVKAAGSAGEFADGSPR